MQEKTERGGWWRAVCHWMMVDMERCLTLASLRVPSTRCRHNSPCCLYSALQLRPRLTNFQPPPIRSRTFHKSRKIGLTEVRFHRRGIIDVWWRTSWQLTRRSRRGLRCARPDGTGSATDRRSFQPRGSPWFVHWASRRRRVIYHAGVTSRHRGRPPTSTAGTPSTPRNEGRWTRLSLAPASTAEWSSRTISWPAVEHATTNKRWSEAPHDRFASLRIQCSAVERAVAKNYWSKLPRTRFSNVEHATAKNCRHEATETPFVRGRSGFPTDSHWRPPPPTRLRHFRWGRRSTPTWPEVVVDAAILTRWRWWWLCGAWRESVRSPARGCSVLVASVVQTSCSVTWERTRETRGSSVRRAARGSCALTTSASTSEHTVTSSTSNNALTPLDCTRAVITRPTRSSICSQSLNHFNCIVSHAPSLPRQVLPSQHLPHRFPLVLPYRDVAYWLLMWDHWKLTYYLVFLKQSFHAVETILLKLSLKTPRITGPDFTKLLSITSNFKNGNVAFET